MALIGRGPKKSSRVFDDAVTAPLELYGESFVARLNDAAALQYVHPIRLDIVEQPLVVGDQDDGAVGRALLVDPARHHLQRIDVETAVGLVEDGQTRLQ